MSEDAVLITVTIVISVALVAWLIFGLVSGNKSDQEDREVWYKDGPDDQG